MAAAKRHKLRPFDDIFHRMRWDETYSTDDDLIIGYEDRVQGSMEMQLQSFTPVSEGGELPMHRVWYVRSGNKVLWDRSCKLDLVFGSGLTSQICTGNEEPSIHAETARRIDEAKANLERLEMEKQHRIDVQRHAAAQKFGSRDALRRRSLLVAAFRTCDADKDGFLNFDEMLVFARYTGFKGHDAEWAREFEQLCVEVGSIPASGIDMSTFEELVNDPSDSGCYCSDAELEQLAIALHQKAVNERFVQHV